MELKAGMPIWAKKNISLSDVGTPTRQIPEDGKCIIQDIYGFVQITYKERTVSFFHSKIHSLFTTVPPKEETEASEKNKSDREIIESVFPSSPVFKSLEEIQKELAEEQEFDYFLQLVAIAPNTYAAIQIINDVSKRYADQYREAYEAEKAENQRLRNEIEKLKNSSL